MAAAWYPERGMDGSRSVWELIWERGRGYGSNGEKSITAGKMSLLPCLCFCFARFWADSRAMPYAEPSQPCGRLGSSCQQ